MIMKKYILRFCSVTTCIILLITCCGVPAFGISDEEQQLLERGWVYDESDGSYYLPPDVYDPVAYPPMTMIAPEPYFPDFNVSKLPWHLAPDYVKKYIYMAFSFDVDNFVVPFVMVRVTASRASVFVGYNLGFGYDGVKDNYRIASPYFTSECNSVCYYATFNPMTYECTSDWRQLSRSAWGDTGKLVSYSSTIAYSSTANDYYFYGGAGVKRSEATSVSYPMYESGGNCYFQMDYEMGYQSGRYFWYQDHAETIMYGQYFVPTSESQAEYNQNQEIIDSIDDIRTDNADIIAGQEEMNDTLETMPDEFASSLDEQIAPSTPDDVDTSAADELDEAESELFTSNYNPDNFSNDFKINIDGKAVGAIFAMMDSVVQIDNEVYAGIIMVLVLGVIALIFNR